jgi:predicted glycosyltransferase
MADLATPIAAPAQDGHGEVIVSAGGGATGEPIFRAALGARPLTRLRDHVWRFLAGPDLPEGTYAWLSGEAGARTVVERFRPDLAARLSVCALSISRAGYNTTMDILESGARAVVVPFETAEETEQRLRSELLQKRGLLTVLPAAALTPERMAEAIDAALDRPAPRPGEINLQGARTTAQILANLSHQGRIRS